MGVGVLLKERSVSWARGVGQSELWEGGEMSILSSNAVGRGRSSIRTVEEGQHGWGSGLGQGQRGGRQGQEKDIRL